MTELNQLQIGDTIRIEEKQAISECHAIENGDQFKIVGKCLDTPSTFAHVIITDNSGEDLQILESEMHAISLVNGNE